MTTTLALPEHRPEWVAEREVRRRIDTHVFLRYMMDAPTPFLRLFPNGEARYAEMSHVHRLRGMALAHGSIAPGGEQ